MLVMGVDPGSRITGFGLVEKADNRMVCIHSGQISAPGGTSFYLRIHYIFQVLVDLINAYHPQQMAVEDIFYAKNAKSSLKLGHARGAVFIAAVQCGVKIFEYSPLQIKSAVVGYGRASKEQVRSMVRILLKLKDNPGLDTSDALAAAICHLNWSRYPDSGNGSLSR